MNNFTHIQKPVEECIHCSASAIIHGHSYFSHISIQLFIPFWNDFQTLYHFIKIIFTMYLLKNYIIKHGDLKLTFPQQYQNPFNYLNGQLFHKCHRHIYLQFVWIRSQMILLLYDRLMYLFNLLNNWFSPWPLKVKIFPSYLGRNDLVCPTRFPLCRFCLHVSDCIPTVYLYVFFCPLYCL